MRLLFSTLPPDLDPLWDRVFQKSDPTTRGHLVIDMGPPHEGTLFILDQSDHDEPAVLALDAHTGDERWRAELRPLRMLPPPDGVWQAALADGGRLVFRGEQSLRCLDAGTGKPLWKADVKGSTTVYRDVIVAVREREISVLSASTGRVVLRKNLTKALTARNPHNGLTLGAAVSETHIYVGDVLGTLWALDRKTGEPVWSHCPLGTAGGLRAPCIAGGRLYASTFTWEPRVPSSLYCWGPAEAGESPGPSSTGIVETEGELAFVIEGIEKGRKLVPRPPFHAAGGDWTVYRCRLGEDAELYFADRGAGGLLRGAEAALWVPSGKDGAALLLAFWESMPHGKRPKGGGLAWVPKPPVILKSVDLLGKGDRQRRKWNTRSGAAEMLVEWDLKTKKGVFREKDDIYRKDVLGLVANLVAR